MEIHTDEKYKEYNTKRQWAKQGFLPKEDAQGIELWANCYCQDSYVYYSPDEVEMADAEQLAEFFTPERKHRNELAKARRIKERAERERLKEWEHREEINKAIRPYLDYINEQKAIIKALTRIQSDNVTNDKTLVIDVETTGLSSEYDEILQLSIIDSEGNVLFDSYFKPFIQSWKEAEKVNGISPDMVENAPRLSEKLIEINSIMCQAKTIIGYNVGFDIDFLRSNGVIVYSDIYIEDIMPVFAEIYGDYNEYYGDFQCQSLSTAANYYGYDWNSRPQGAHNSLSDCFATLFVYNKICENQ